MIPQITILLGIILLISFVGIGGIDDIPENIQIFILGAVAGGALMFVFK